MGKLAAKEGKRKGGTRDGVPAQRVGERRPNLIGMRTMAQEVV
jgi:hypothetical protein